jgi:16S rRNA (adenine1518-N6/adenine1519-N6)-dimethyltransferase
MYLTPQEYFRLHGSRPRKRFGQHFLVQSAVARRIVASADLAPSDVVVEVGPGLGALTQFIAEQVNVLHLVELDRDLAAYLSDITPAGECRMQVHAQDVLSFDFAGLAQQSGGRLVLLGNLPYNISSPLLFRLLESGSSLQRAVFMLQREVGERITASPGTKSYGVLSVLIGVYATVTSLFVVGPKQFYPPPRVDSLVVRLDFHDQPLLDEATFGFLRGLVNAAFQHRRKTLQNSLRGLTAPAAMPIPDALAVAGIDSRRRPETLHLDEFVRLAAVLLGRDVS